MHGDDLTIINPLYPRLFYKKSAKMGPIVIYYHVNSIGLEYNWIREDCPQLRTVGYNGLIIVEFGISWEEIGLSRE